MITKAKFITNEKELKQAERFGQTVEEEYGWFEFGFDVREVIAYSAISESVINIHFRTGFRFSVQNNDRLIEYLREHFLRV